MAKKEDTSCFEPSTEKLKIKKKKRPVMFEREAKLVQIGSLYDSH